MILRLAKCSDLAVAQTNALCFLPQNDLSLNAKWNRNFMLSLQDNNLTITVPGVNLGIIASVVIEHG